MSKMGRFMATDQKVGGSSPFRFTKTKRNIIDI